MENTWMLSEIGLTLLSHPKITSNRKTKKKSCNSSLHRASLYHAWNACFRWALAHRFSSRLHQITAHHASIIIKVSTSLPEQDSLGFTWFGHTMPHEAVLAFILMSCTSHCGALLNFYWPRFVGVLLKVHIEKLPVVCWSSLGHIWQGPSPEG